MVRWIDGTCIFGVTVGRSTVGKQTVGSQVPDTFCQWWVYRRIWFFFFFFAFVFFLNFLSSKMAIYYLDATIKMSALSRLLFAADTTLGVGKVCPPAVPRALPSLARLTLTHPWGPTSMTVVSLRGDRDLLGPGVGCPVLGLCPTYGQGQLVPRSCWDMLFSSELLWSILISKDLLLH